MPSLREWQLFDGLFANCWWLRAGRQCGVATAAHGSAEHKLKRMIEKADVDG